MSSYAMGRAEPSGTRTTMYVLTKGSLRTYRLYVPDQMPLARAVPVVLVLHGFGHDPTFVEYDSQMDQLANAQKFAVAYPMAIDKAWNAGACCGTASQNGVDDVSFLVDVIRSVQSTVWVDPNRVYMTGFSNGAMMAVRFGCAHPELVAAVASVEGTLETDCRPAKPVSVLQISGERDRTVPYGGVAYSTLVSGPIAPVSTMLRTLSDVDGCQPTPTRRLTRIATYSEYQGCAVDSQLSYTLVKRADHRWPNVANSGFDTNNAIWDFFRAHRSQVKTLAIPALHDVPRPRSASASHFVDR